MPFIIDDQQGHACEQMQQKLLFVTQRGVAQVQALQVLNPTLPFTLTIRMGDGGFGQGLWQKQGKQKCPVDLWSQWWEGAESQHCLTKKQQQHTLLCVPGQNHRTDRWLGVDVNSPVVGWHRLPLSCTGGHTSNSSLFLS